ncbi:MAG: hypothetical protein MK086_10325 [Flavobacteriales bacterium]|nr:hypothetical protein [Flavobacteriales bacterium]
MLNTLAPFRSSADYASYRKIGSLCGRYGNFAQSIFEIILSKNDRQIIEFAANLGTDELRGIV